MRKDELLYLHHLLALLRQEYERREVVPNGAFASYDALGVSPMAVYASKRQHERAVKALADGLATATPGAGEREQTAPSP